MRTDADEFDQSVAAWLDRHGIPGCTAADVRAVMELPSGERGPVGRRVARAYEVITEAWRDGYDGIID